MASLPIYMLLDCLTHEMAVKTRLESGGIIDAQIRWVHNGLKNIKRINEVTSSGLTVILHILQTDIPF